MAMLHMANDSGLFRSRAELEAKGNRLEGNIFTGPSGNHVPLIEAKMLSTFDHRFGTYEGATQAHFNKGFLPRLTDEDHADPRKVLLPDMWVAESEVDEALGDRWTRAWFLGWRDICRRTDVRTVIPALIPRAAVGDKFPLLLSSAPPREVACLCGNLCSFALDYAARQKVGGTALKYFTMRQLPVLPPSTYASRAPWSLPVAVGDWVLQRVLELTYTAWDLAPFAKDVGYNGPPFRWDPLRRSLLRAELDAAFFHLYGIVRDDVAYVLDTFPIIRRNDEKAHGEFRTQRLVLEAYDAMAEAIRTGKPNQTRLDPPPADPRVAHPSRATKKRDAPARIEVLPDAVWERPQPYKPADTGVVIAAVLKTLGGPAPAARVRLAAILSLEPRLVTSPDSKELAEWRRLVGSEASPLPKNVAALVPRADLGWGGAVQLLRGNGLLVEDLGAKTWAPGNGLEEVATEGWAEGRVRWVIDLIARRGEALAEALPAEIRRLVDEAAA
jgi:hypothetical protein